MTGQAPATAPTPNRPTGTGPTSGRTDGVSTRPASSGPRGTDRAGRRERTRVGPKPTFFQRFRTPIMVAAVVGVIALVGAGLFSAATQPVYACSTIWQPNPTPTPPEGASPQPGYVQPDMGNGHVPPGTKITYTYCAPASGDHYNVSGQGPIQPRLYGPEDTVIPPGWVHNLEHGALVLLYRGDSAAATPAGQAALRAFYDAYPPSPVCGWPPGTTVGPIFARFDQMAWPMAAIVWDRVLPLQELDTEAVLEFDRIYGEQTNRLVEDLCPDKRVSPSPSAPASAVPSASPSASVAPSSSPSASAAPSGSAAPSAAPSASPGPS
jgi:hypothetical protein